MSEITHVILELDNPIEEKYWEDEDWSNEYYGVGRRLIHCCECKHKPKRNIDDDDRNGFNLEFPDERCPCQCDDPWYSWMPDDNWYCGNGERKTDDE